MAALAPTSLVFGAWDSRDTQAKAPRLLSSTIRAFDVRKLTRSAQYVPAIDYVGAGQLDEPADKNTSDAYAKRGFVHVPASSTHGGVIAKEIRRDATLHLAALRLLAAGDGADKTVALRRYVLGLALTAFTYTPAGFLRQGCNLVPDADKGSELKLVLVDGSREDLKLTHDDARAFAKVAAREFGIDPDRNIDHKRLPDREVQFDKALVAKELTEAADGAKRQGRKKAK
jgi:CRISPR-associated protein Csb1